MPPLDLAPDHHDTGPRRPALLAVLIAAAFFAMVAPTLRWQDFSGGSENLVVETVLEMRRGEPWLIPTLMKEPRVSKPPLAAWITAAAVRPDTVARLSSRDKPVRDAAFRDLAWQVRWPSLLCACAMLLATYALARNLLLGPGVALASVAVCGSTLLFLRFARAATTDVQLALWVTAANAFLALAIFRGRRWAGCIGAGAAVGLALMSKGPVSLVQTVVPFALVVAWRRWAEPPSPGNPGEASGSSDRPGEGRGEGGRKSQISNLKSQKDPHPNPLGGSRPFPSLPPEYRERGPSLAAPAVAGFSLMLLIGLPWYAWVLFRHPGIARSWWTEVTREGATQLPPDPWYMYSAFLLWVIPWLAWFVAGLWVGLVRMVEPLFGRRDGDTKAARDGMTVAFLLFLVPVVVMSFFRDKPERYLLPVLPPAAALCAGAAVRWWHSSARDAGGRVIEAVHWLTLALLAIGVAFGGLVARRFGAGEAWWSTTPSTTVGIAGIAVVIAGCAVRAKGGRAALAAVGATATLMLLLQFPVMRAYGRDSVSDVKVLADLVWSQYPDAQIYQYEPGGRLRVRVDLPIYLGRVSRAIGAGQLPRAPTDRPQVVVFLDRYAAQAPQLPPPWEELASGGGRKGGWRAYVLPASQP